MRLPFPARLLSAVLGAVLLLVALAAPAEAGERRTKDGHLLKWDDGIEHLADDVERQLPDIQATVARRLGFPFEGGPATIHVARGFDGMRRATGHPVPQWAGGVCVARASLIVLRADRIYPPTAASSVGTVLRHEWVHLAWARKAGIHTRRLPLWAEEGIAEVVGGGISVDAGASLDFAATWGKLIPWDEISTRFPREAERAGLAYRQGTSWIGYFTKRTSWDQLRRVLADVAAGIGDFDRILRLHTERNLGDWTADWHASLESTASPWFHLLGHDIGWTMIIFLSVISFWFWWRHRARRRREIEALPDG